MALLALSYDERLKPAIERAMHSLSSEEIIEGLRECGDAVSRTVELRSFILKDPAFWHLTTASFETVRQIAPTLNDALAILDAVSRADRSDLARAFFEKFGFDTVLSFIDHASLKPDLQVRQTWMLWLDLLLSDQSALSARMEQGGICSKELLQIIAKKTHTDDLPTRGSRDPWITAIEGATGQIYTNFIYLYSYLLGRAFGYATESQVELLEVSLQRVYDAAIDSTVPDEAWSLISYRLPRAPLFFEWDRCRRLREGTANLLLNRNISQLRFIELSISEELFSEICSLIASRGSFGKSYLQEALRELHNKPKSKFQYRTHVLKKFDG
jgi:hypothetical protein